MAQQARIAYFDRVEQGIRQLMVLADQARRQTTGLPQAHGSGAAVNLMEAIDFLNSKDFTDDEVPGGRMQQRGRKGRRGGRKGRSSRSTG